MAYLELQSGENSGERYMLDGERAILGRHPDCDIVLDVGAISRQHAQILKSNGEYVVEDLQSRNGTFVNGEAVQAPRVLKDGDRLKICDLSFTFYLAPPSGKTVTAANLATLMGGGVLVDDTENTTRSSIMSKLDITSGSAGVRLSVNPEAKLRALIEITQNLRKSLAVDKVLPKLLDSLFKIFVQADRGFVVLRGPVEGQLKLQAVKQRREDSEDTIRISRTIMKQVLADKQAILSADAASDARFEMSQSIADFRIRSMMCAPLIDSDGEVLGAIQIDTLDQRSQFQQDDLDMLAGVAGQAAFALENAQLHEQALKQHQIQRDLELAHKVQQALLPSTPPKLDGYHFFDFYEAANQVGGDFYDYILLPGNRLAVVLADVSGKGVSAALVMAKLSAEVRYCLASETSVAAAINRINHGFCSSGWDDRFVTLVMTVLDPARDGDDRQCRPHAAAAAARARRRVARGRRRVRRAAGGGFQLSISRQHGAARAGPFRHNVHRRNQRGDERGQSTVWIGAIDRTGWRPGGQCGGAGQPDSGRREKIRRRPAPERRHVPGLCRP